MLEADALGPISRLSVYGVGNVPPVPEFPWFPPEFSELVRRALRRRNHHARNGANTPHSRTTTTTSEKLPLWYARYRSTASTPVELMRHARRRFRLPKSVRPENPVRAAVRPAWKAVRYCPAMCFHLSFIISLLGQIRLVTAYPRCVNRRNYGIQRRSRHCRDHPPFHASANRSEYGPRRARPRSWRH